MQSAQGLSSDNGSYSSNSHAAALPAPVSNGRAAAAAALPPAVSFPTPSFSAPAAASPLPSVFSGDGKKDVGLYGASVAAVVFFAGVVAPVLEDKVGLGGECKICSISCICIILLPWRPLLEDRVSLGGDCSCWSIFDAVSIVSCCTTPCSSSIFSCSVPALHACNVCPSAGLQALLLKRWLWALPALVVTHKHEQHGTCPATSPAACLSIVDAAGPAYYDFIASRGLPTQMAEVRARQGKGG